MLTCLNPYQYGNYLVFLYPDRDDKLESALTHLLVCQPNLRQRHQPVSGCCTNLRTSRLDASIASVYPAGES